MNETAIFNTGSGSTIAGRDIVITPPDDKRSRAERKTDEGRKCVRQWGARVGEAGWDNQAWHFLGHALQFTRDAVTIDSDYQPAWTLLADIYHRIGK